MGKGDRKTRRGKIFAKSYGNTRKHKPRTSADKAVSKTPRKARPASKKTAARKKSA